MSNSAEGGRKLIVVNTNLDIRGDTPDRTTLREAIEETQQGGPDDQYDIIFQNPGDLEPNAELKTGPWTIELDEPLPPIRKGNIRFNKNLSITIEGENGEPSQTPYFAQNIVLVPANSPYYFVQANGSGSTSGTHSLMTIGDVAAFFKSGADIDTASYGADDGFWPVVELNQFNFIKNTVQGGEAETAQKTSHHYVPAAKDQFKQIATGGGGGLATGAGISIVGGDVQITQSVFQGLTVKGGEGSRKAVAADSSKGILGREVFDKIYGRAKQIIKNGDWENVDFGDHGERGGRGGEIGGPNFGPHRRQINDKIGRWSSGTHGQTTAAEIDRELQLEFQVNRRGRDTPLGDPGTEFYGPRYGSKRPEKDNKISTPSPNHGTHNSGMAGYIFTSSYWERWGKNKKGEVYSRGEGLERGGSRKFRTNDNGQIKYFYHINGEDGSNTNPTNTRLFGFGGAGGSAGGQGGMYVRFDGTLRHKFGGDGGDGTDGNAGGFGAGAGKGGQGGRGVQSHIEHFLGKKEVFNPVDTTSGRDGAKGGMGGKVTATKGGSGAALGAGISVLNKNTKVLLDSVDFIGNTADATNGASKISDIFNAGTIFHRNTSFRNSPGNNRTTLSEVLSKKAQKRIFNYKSNADAIIDWEAATDDSNMLWDSNEQQGPYFYGTSYITSNENAASLSSPPLINVSDAADVNIVTFERGNEENSQIVADQTALTNGLHEAFKLAIPLEDDKEIEKEYQQEINSIYTGLFSMYSGVDEDVVDNIMTAKNISALFNAKNYSFLYSLKLDAALTVAGGALAAITSITEGHASAEDKLQERRDKNAANAKLLKDLIKTDRNIVFGDLTTSDARTVVTIQNFEVGEDTIIFRGMHNLDLEFTQRNNGNISVDITGDGVNAISNSAKTVAIIELSENSKTLIRRNSSGLSTSEYLSELVQRNKATQDLTLGTILTAEQEATQSTAESIFGPASTSVKVLRLDGVDLDNEFKIFSMSGNDIVRGSKGREVIRTEDGTDTIYPGLGNDKVYGGNGFDTAIYRDEMQKLYIKGKTNIKSGTSMIEVSEKSTDGEKQQNIFKDVLIDIESVHTQGASIIDFRDLPELKENNSIPFYEIYTGAGSIINGSKSNTNINISFQPRYNSGKSFDSILNTTLTVVDGNEGNNHLTLDLGEHYGDLKVVATRSENEENRSILIKTQNNHPLVKARNIQHLSIEGYSKPSEEAELLPSHLKNKILDEKLQAALESNGEFHQPIIRGDIEMLGIKEDSVDEQGQSISEILAHNFFDLDDSSLLGILSKRTINNDSNGSWQFRNPNGEWGIINDNNESHIFISAHDFIRFVPDSNYNGPSDPLLFYTVDTSNQDGLKTGETKDLTVETDTNGLTGQNADLSISKEYATLLLNVEPTKDAPEILRDSLTMPGIMEDSSNYNVATPTISYLTEYTYLDADEKNSISPYAVAIVSNQATSEEGQWQYFGWESQNDWRTIGHDLNNRNALFMPRSTKLRFLPAANFSGTPGSLEMRYIDRDIEQANEFTLGEVVNTTSKSFKDSISAGKISLETEIAGINDSPEPLQATIANPQVTNSAGETIGNLFQYIFSDPDNDTFKGVGIKTNDLLQMQPRGWEFSIDNGNSWTPIYQEEVEIKQDSLLFLSVDTRLRFNRAQAEDSTINSLPAHLIDNGQDEPNHFINHGSNNHPFNSINKNHQFYQVVDIDGDGDLDIWGSAHKYDDIESALFKNNGTLLHPSFDEAISTPHGFSKGSSQTPISEEVLIDIDNDGDYDIIAKSDVVWDLVFVENTGSPSEPKYATPKHANTHPWLNDFEELEWLVNFPLGNDAGLLFEYSVFVDIDGDRDQDALTYHFEEDTFYFTENSGTPEAPYYEEPVPNSFGLHNVGIMINKPGIGDMDQDGDFDLFAATRNGEILYYENIGDAQNPMFKLFRGPDSRSNRLNPFNKENSYSYIKNAVDNEAPKNPFNIVIRDWPEFEGVVHSKRFKYFGVGAYPLVGDFDSDGDDDLLAVYDWPPHKELTWYFENKPFIHSSGSIINLNNEAQQTNISNIPVLLSPDESNDSQAHQLLIIDEETGSYQLQPRLGETVAITQKGQKLLGPKTSNLWDAISASNNLDNGGWNLLLQGSGKFTGHFSRLSINQKGQAKKVGKFINKDSALINGWEEQFGDIIHPDGHLGVSLVDIEPKDGMIDCFDNYTINHDGKLLPVISKKNRPLSNTSSKQWNLAQVTRSDENGWQGLLKGQSKKLLDKFATANIDVSGKLKVSSRWISKDQALSQGFEKLFGDTIRRDGIIGVPLDDKDGNGILDGSSFYNVNSNEFSLALTSKKGKLLSGKTSKQWDAIRAIELDEESGWKLLIERRAKNNSQFSILTFDQNGIQQGAQEKWRTALKAEEAGWGLWFTDHFKTELGDGNVIGIEDPTHSP